MVFTSLSDGFGSFFIDIKNGIPFFTALTTNISDLWSVIGAGAKWTIGLTALSTIYGLAKFGIEQHEKQIQLAQESAKAYADSAKSIQDYKSESEDLIRSIKSGTLSEEELLNARSRLYEIEGEMNASYGTQAEV